ncbi:MAG: L,D-transpeptidase family protein [Candidatus Moranbacteria bacterium]|nr:L,D-transpeptidase family protein [Candidatus Moranbacteria bacterium]
MKALFCSLIFFAAMAFSCLVFAGQAPEGFVEYEVKKGDTLSALIPQEYWILAEKVNRTDRFHLRPGQTILLPINDEAFSYCPLRKFDSRFKSLKKLFYANLEKQVFAVYREGELAFWGPICSGAEGHRTITGWFEVLGKERKKKSKKYNGTPMPYSLWFHGHYFIHKQALPGKAVSKGCIRLLEVDAIRVFYLFEIGDVIFIE